MYTYKYLDNPTYIYLGGGMVADKIYGEISHAFSDHTYIKNMIDTIENIFEPTLNNYG